MNKLDNAPTASHEMAQRIDTLKARISGYDHDEIETAERRLAAARSDLHTDETLLAQWEDIARRSA